MKRVIISLLAIYMPLLGLSQGNVYWMHGFQGEEPGRWELYEAMFEDERNLTSLTPDYGANPADMENGIGNAAQVVSTQVVDASNSVYIGHSMGGLVAREMDRRGLRNMGGIVTVGTPNKGARIANSLRANRVLPSLESGLIELSRGPNGSQIVNTATIIFAGMTVNQFLNELWLGLVNADGVSQLLNGNSNTIRDLSAGSAFIESINEYDPNIPIINIITEENNDQAVRMAAAALNAPEEQPLHTFDDTEVLEHKKTAISVYKGAKDGHLILRFVQLWNYGFHSRRADDWRAGEIYLKHTFETDYDELIGAQRYEMQTRTRSVYVCDPPSGGRGSGGGTGGGTGGSGGGIPIPVPLPGGAGFERATISPLPSPENNCIDPDEGPCLGSNCRWEQETYQARVRISEGSDGLIPLSSQRMDNMADGDVYDAKGVNHLEVGNHPRMTEIFNDIFNRERSVFYRPL